MTIISTAPITRSIGAGIAVRYVNISSNQIKKNDVIATLAIRRRNLMIFSKVAVLSRNKASNTTTKAKPRCVIWCPFESWSSTCVKVSWYAPIATETTAKAT